MGYDTDNAPWEPEEEQAPYAPWEWEEEEGEDLSVDPNEPVVPWDPVHGYAN